MNRKLGTTVLLLFIIGLAFFPLMSVNVQGAIITINTDTYWITSQTNVDGYIVNGGATLYICANGSIGDIVIVFGDAGVGDFTIQDEGRIVFVTGNNSNVIYFGGGGVAPNQANRFLCYGVIETRYLGTSTTPTVMIGIGATGNKTVDSGHVIMPQPEHTIENIWFVSDFLYQLYQYCGNALYYKNCKFGDGTEAYGMYTEQSKTIWLEDCEFDITNNPINPGVGCTINEVGTLNKHGKVDLLSTGLDIYRYWARLFPNVQDESGNPIDNATITIMDQFGKASWAAKSNSTGRVNSSACRYGLEYLLALNTTRVRTGDFPYYDAMYLNVSRDSTPSVITVSAPGYVTNVTTHNMTLDWGNATDPVNFTLEADPLERANQTIRTYSENVTVEANLSSTFLYNSTVWANGSITFENAYNNVNVNVTLANTTNETFAWLLNTTHNFHASILVNLTELNGGVLNWTPTRDGQLHVNVRTYLNNEVQDFNVTEDFLISNLTSTWTNTTTIVPPGYNVDLYPSFSYEPGKALAISFTDMSVFSAGFPITKYEWDFGDGTPLIFTQNPEHRYGSPGTYTVTLEVTNINGESKEVSQEIPVRPTPFPLWPYFLICLGVAAMIFMGMIYNKRDKLRKAVVVAAILLWGGITLVVLQYTMFPM